MLLGALGLVLVALKLTGDAVGALLGDAARRFLARTEGRGLLAYLLGGSLTTLAPSSALGLTLVAGLADARAISLSTAAAAAAGATVGSTLALLFALAWAAELAWAALAAGALLFVVGGVSVQRVGQAVVGVGLLLMGLQTLSRSLGPLGADPVAGPLAAAISAEPFALAAIGFLLALVATSSNAVAALAVGLVASGLLTPAAGVAIVAGAAPGTATAARLLLARAGLIGRRAVTVPLLSKLVVALGVVASLDLVNAGLQAITTVPTHQVALAHVGIALAASLVALALLPAFLRAATLLVPETDADREFAPKFLDQALLERPAVALIEARRELDRAARYSERAVEAGWEALIGEGDPGRVEPLEDRVDHLVPAITTYASRLAATSPGDSRPVEVSIAAQRIEAIADQAKKLARLARKLRSEGLEFSPAGRSELVELGRSVRARLHTAMACLMTLELDLADQLLAGRRDLKQAISRSKVAHLSRLGDEVTDSHKTSRIHLDTLEVLDQIDLQSTEIAAMVPSFAGQPQPNDSGSAGATSSGPALGEVPRS